MTVIKTMQCRGLGLIMTLALLIGGAQAQTLVSIDRPDVNMRAGASTSNEVLWTLARGYPLKVLARKRGWLKVEDFEGDTGWVLARLTGTKPHVVVKVSTANIRSKPGTSHRVVGRAEYGDVLRTLERRAGWVRVRPLEGPGGWVARRLLWGW